MTEVPQSLELRSEGVTCQAVTSSAFRGIFRMTVGTVAVVTAGAGEPVGFTASSVTSVSVDPPMVTVGVARSSRSWPVIDRASHMGVHFLRSDQGDCARRFAENGSDKFSRQADWYWGPHRVPVLRDCMSSLLCEVSTRLRVSDASAVVVARVVATRVGSGSEPLTFGNGRYNDELPQERTAVVAEPPFRTGSTDG